MAVFSERYGYKKPRTVLQQECMDDSLRMGIYNAIYRFFGEYQRDSIAVDILGYLWTDHWHFAIDDFPSGYWEFYPRLRGRINEAKWYEPYDLIEFLAKEIKAVDDEDGENEARLAAPSCQQGTLTMLDAFSEEINEALTREMSGYRLVGISVVPITSEAELVSIEEALVVDDVFSGVRLHMGSALEHFSKKPEPDYRNTVKEAISAVEAAADAVTTTESNKLGDKINELRDTHGLHSALAEGWKKLYGFTSDEGGIRHWASSDEVNVDFALAKYMLVSCSAFVNYLIEISFKEGDR